MRVIDLEEREIRFFPREVLFDGTGRSLLLPETRKLAAIDLREVLDGVELRALGLIGYLPLTAEVALNIQPKFPMKSLWSMLSIADEDYRRVLPVLRTYESVGANPPHQILARGFCHFLRQILSLGVARGYYQEPHNGHYKPKVNFGRTIARFASRGDDVNVSSDIFTFSADLHVNGLIKSACLAFLYRMPRIAQWHDDRVVLLTALNALQRISEKKMLPGDQAYASAAPAWTRAAYDGALTVYSVLLGFTKVGFGYDAHGSSMPSFLFCLDDIFESFVRNSFREGVRAFGISVLDGNISKHQMPLFVDSKVFPIKPDLVFRQGKMIKALGEVKYKPKISEADRYQLISHVLATKAPIGFWISPAGGRTAGIEYVGAIATGQKLYHYRLDIGDDLDAAVQGMLKEVTELFA